MTDDLTDEQIEEMRGVLDDVPDSSAHWRHEGYHIVDSYESIVVEDVHDLPENRGATGRHIATFDPPTVRRLLNAAEERNELRERVEELECALTDIIACGRMHSHEIAKEALEGEDDE